MKVSEDVAGALQRRSERRKTLLEEGWHPGDARLQEAMAHSNSVIAAHLAFSFAEKAKGKDDPYITQYYQRACSVMNQAKERHESCDTSEGRILSDILNGAVDVRLEKSRALTHELETRAREAGLTI